MGFYEDRLLPRVIDVALGSPPFEDIRARVCEGLSGEVLEVGFGSGRNVAHYPADVERVRAIEPASGARSLAESRVAAAAVPVEFVGLDGAHVPIDDDAVDHVLVTWTLCTIPDVSAAVAEMHRVLRPGGTLHFVEHGHAPNAKTAKWQTRITPVWRRLAGGCHLDRRIDELVSGAGFALDVRTYQMQGPSIATFMYEGTATKV